MTVEERAQSLVQRLDREILRVEAGTVAVGGLTKAGNDLEALLKTAASLHVRGQGSTLEVELRRLRVSAGAGTYARILADARPAALGPIGEAIARDVRAPRASRILALIALRNANAHEGADPKAYKSTLAGVAALLRPFLVTGR
jgi:hypothetical protein